MKSYWFTWICWGLGCALLPAQTPSMLHFEVEDGLPGNLVYCAVQDQQGYLWLGTDKGLSRFDGQGFFNYGTENGLPDPEVLNLHQDAVGRLWVACFRQKPVYRLAGRFVNEQADSLLNRLTMKNAGYVFSETRDSTLWIVSGGVFSRKNAVQIQYPLKSIDAVVDLDGQMLGLSGSQIVRIVGKDQPQQTTAETIYTFKKWANSYTQSGNRLLYAFPDQTLLLEYRDGRVQTVAQTKSVFQTVYTDRLGRFWGAAPGKGVVCFANNQRDLSQPVWYLHGKKISGIYHDLQGNFWFPSLGEGVYLRPKAQAWHWDQSDGLPSSNVRAVQMTPEGVLLAGDDLGNVHRIAAGRLVSSQSLGSTDGSNFVRQMLPTAAGACWVVCDDGFWPERGGTAQRLWQVPQGTLSAGAPKAMARAGEVLWLGSSQGIASWDPSRQTMPQLVKKGRVTAMVVDDEQQLWVGGIEGLYSQHDQFTYNWGERFEVLKQRVVALASGGPHRLWVVTPQAGLLEVRVAAGQVQDVRVVNQTLLAPIKDIKKVFPDPQGPVWLATNKGVFCVRPTGETVQFTVGQGLASNEVNDLLVWRDTLWVATPNGLSLLDLHTTQSSRRTVADISHVRYQLGDSTVLVDLATGAPGSRHHLVLAAGARQVSAWYVGLQAHPGDVRTYRHVQTIEMLPFPWYTFPNLIKALWGHPDTIWLEKPNYDFGHQLAAGHYRIRTTLVSFDGVASSHDAELSLIALPHWTETVWVWLAALGLLVFLSSRYYRMRMRYLQADVRMFQLKHQALKAQINPHFVGNSINAIQQFFYPPDPAKASEYIHLFTLLLRKTLVLSERDFSSFAEEVAYNRDYLEMMQLRYGDQFVFRIEGADEVDPHLVFPTMLLQPLVENATLHGLAETGVSELTLRFWQDPTWCYCTVCDNGPGFRVSQARKQEQGGSERQSFGMHLLQEKARMLNQLYPLEIALEWTDLSETGAGSGTCVAVRFKRLLE